MDLIMFFNHLNERYQVVNIQSDEPTKATSSAAIRARIRFFYIFLEWADISILSSQQ